MARRDYAVTYTETSHIIVAASTPEVAASRAVAVLRNGRPDRIIKVIQVEEA